jgi:hypothetical protein
MALDIFRVHGAILKTIKKFSKISIQFLTLSNDTWISLARLAIESGLPILDK